MSGRSGRSRYTKVSEETEVVSTPVSSQSFTISSRMSSSGSKNRVPSPGRLTRMQEKQELQSLNDRFASYIDRVRELEKENYELLLKIQSYENFSTSPDSGSVKALYEKELTDVRKLLDEIARQKAEVEIDVGKHKGDVDDLKMRLLRLEREYDTLEKKYLEALKQAEGAQAEANEAVKQKEHVKNENMRLRMEISTLEKALQTAKTELEGESLLRVDLENRYQSLNEELGFQKQLHQDELKETRSRLEVTLEDVDQSRRIEYESNLREALEDLRAELSEQAILMKQEASSFYESKIADLSKLANRQTSFSSVTRDEVIMLRSRADELSSEIARLRDENGKLEKRLKAMEDDQAKERDAFRSDLHVRDMQIEELRTRMLDQLQEYQDLMDVKIRLDAEISAYRKLLEGEEDRLSHLEASLSEGSSAKKRKLVSGRSSFLGSSYEEVISTNGPIEISAVDMQEKFIQLTNVSESEDVHIGNWRLVFTADGEDIEYRFNARFNLKAGQSVKVYGSDSTVVHAAPHTLVMKGKNWHTSGVNLKASLIEGDAEKSSRQLTKNSRSERRFVTASRSGKKGLKDESCCVM